MKRSRRGVGPDVAVDRDEVLPTFRRSDEAGRLGRAGVGRDLILGRRRDERERGGVVDPEVEVLGRRRRPGVPLEEDAGFLVRREREVDPLVSRREVVERVPAAGERSGPVTLRLVAGRHDPEDPGVAPRLHDPVRRVRPAAAVAAARVVEARGEVEDRDPVCDGVVLRQAEIDDVLDTDQVQLGLGCHLVHDLGDGRPVLARPEVVAEAPRRQRRRQLALGLQRGVVGEADVDDPDFHTGSLVAVPVGDRRVRGGDAFPGDRGGRRALRRLDDANARGRREPGQVLDRDERLRQVAVGAVEEGAAGCERGAHCAGAPALGFDDDLDPVAGDVEVRPPGNAERGRKPAGPVAVDDLVETSVERERGGVAGRAGGRGPSAVVGERLSTPEGSEGQGPQDHGEQSTKVRRRHETPSVPGVFQQLLTASSPLCAESIPRSG